MKTKKLFMFFLSVLLVVTLSIFAFACTGDDELEPTSLTINSKTEVTIEIGQEYTLLYSCNGTVTVSASGGNYDEDSHKFSASEAGVYTLVVTGVEEGKAETSLNVTITVTAGADKSVINTAIQKTNGLIASDYTTASWAALTSAKATANSMLNAYGKTQEEVNAAAQDVEDAIKNLVPAAITKATVSDEKIVVGTTNYFAEDYENYEDIIAEIEKLNADTNVKLNSVYSAKLAEILDTLVAKPVLNITGAPDGIMLVNERVPYEMTAEADEGASIVWKLNGKQVSTGTTYTYTPASFSESFSIEVTSTVGEGENAKTKTVTYSGKFAKTAYTVAPSLESKVTVDKNVISSEKVGWDDAKGKKVVLSDLSFSGDVTVYFDLTFEEIGSPAVMGIFFLNAAGNDIDNWAVVNANTGFIEVATVGNDASKVRVDSATTTLNKTYHFKATRYIEDGKGYLSIWQLDDNGRVIVENLGKNIAKDYVGAVKIGIQTENAKGKVSNIRVSSDTEILDKSALGEAIRTYGTLEYAESDYTAESLKDYKSALSTANATYNSSVSDQMAVENAATNLKKAYDALTLKEVVYLEISGDTFEYGDKTYNKVNYKNYEDVVASINNLKEANVKPQSVYDAKVAEILATLEETASINVTPSYALGKHLVQEIPTEAITFAATVETGVTVEWKLNGKVVTEGLSEDGLTLTYVPVEGEYVVEAVAKFGEAVSSPVVLTGGFYKTNYKVHENYTDKISVENNVINVHGGGTGWDAERGQKVILDNINLEGEFVVTMDVKFNTNAIMALFLLNHNGENGGPSYVVVNNGSRFLGVGINQSGGEPHYVFPEGSTIADNGNTFTLRVTRSNDNGTWHLVGEMLDADGKVIVSGDRDGCRSDRITFGIQTETGTFEVSNINVVSGKVISKDAINETISEIGETDKSINLRNLFVNYEKAEAEAYKVARQEIFDAYYDANSTKERIDNAVKGYESALKALLEAKKELVKAVVTENSFTYNGIAYTSTAYTNLVGEDEGTEYVLALVTALNANEEIDNIYDYDNAISEIIDKLVPALEFSVTGAPALGDLLVNSLPEYTITVDTNATKVVWTVDGVALEETDSRLSEDGKTLTYKATEYGEFSIEVVAESGENSASAKYEGKFINAEYTVNVDGATVDNNVVSINKGFSWDDHKGKKVTLNDIYLLGEFTVQFDLEFTGESGIMAMFFLTDNGMIHDDASSGIWTAINKSENFLEMAVNGRNSRRYKMPEGTTDGLMHIQVSRYLAEDELYYWSAQLLGDNGEALPLRWNVGQIFDEVVVYENNSKDAGKDWQNNYKGAIKLGIQAENGTFKVSNITLASAGNVVDRTALRKAIKSAEALILNDYTEETAQAVRDAVVAATLISNNHTPDQTDADEACKTLLEAIESLVLLNKSEYIAEVADGDVSFTYNNVTYIAINYGNFTALLAEIKALNESEEIATRTAYDTAIKAIIARLESAVKVELSGITEGNLIVEELIEYTLKANATSVNANPSFVYEWTVNGEVVADATSATYNFVPETFGKYVISVKATDSNNNTYQTATLAFSFTEDIFAVPDGLKNKVSVENNVVEATDFMGWVDNTGKKVLFENLIFNGSFSVTMDVNVTEVTGGAHVITLHVFNADSINGGATSYGCLRLQDNMLEVRNGDSKTTLPNAIDRSKTITVKVTVYKYSSNNFIRTMFSVIDQTTGEWIDYSPDNQVTNYGLEHGQVIGINIENVKATFSNFRYELLKDAKYGNEACIDGSLASKLPLVKALEQYKVNLEDYLNGEAKEVYSVAYQEAREALNTNELGADYVSVIEPLKTAYEALLELRKSVDVKVSGYYTNYQNISEEHDIVADFGDIEVTGISWTYDFTADGAEEAEAKTVESATLTIGTAKGTYANVKLHFTYEDKEWAYDYNDITVGEVKLATSDSNNVSIGSDENGANATMLNGTGWDRKDAIYLDGVNASNFELSFDVERKEGNVFAINLFGTSVTPVCRFERGQIGFDQYNYDSGDDTMHYIGVDGGSDALCSGIVTFTLKMVKNSDGTYTMTFAVSSAGVQLATRTWADYRNSNASTSIRFTVEHKIGTFSNFKLMYN